MNQPPMIRILRSLVVFAALALCPSLAAGQAVIVPSPVPACVDGQALIWQSSTSTFMCGTAGSGGPYSGTTGTFSGAVTAASFAGPLTGNVTGNVTGNTSGTAGSTTGNAATVTGLAVTGGQTLTVTTGGTLGSAAYTASSAYDAAGAAAAVTPTTLGLVIGTNVQAYNANLTGINQALATTASPTFVTVTGNLTGNASGTAANVTGLVAVPNGGTDRATMTPFAVLAGGTTATGALQQVSGLGTSGFVLTSNGAGALPTFQAAPGGSSSFAAGIAIDGATVSTAGVRFAAAGATPAATANTLYSPDGAALYFNGTLLATGSAATTTAITDDTATNATMYPTWVTTASGNQALKVSSTKVTFNPSTGLLTATGFSGPLTGNVTGNASGTAATVTDATQAAITSAANLATVGTITTGTWTATDVAVADGGTGRSTSTTAYGVLAAGTTATGAHQTISPGTTGQVLTSNGAAALPTFQTAAGGGGGDYVRLYAASGTSTGTGATIMDSFALSGLTILDTLEVEVSLTPSAASAGFPGIRNTTDSLMIAEVADNVTVGGPFQARFSIRCSPNTPTKLGIIAQYNNNGALTQQGTNVTFTQDFTGSWTMGLRYASMASGTMNWSWAIYKKKGQ